MHADSELLHIPQAFEIRRTHRGKILVDSNYLRHEEINLSF